MRYQTPTSHRSRARSMRKDATKAENLLRQTLLVPVAKPFGSKRVAQNADRLGPDAVNGQQFLAGATGYLLKGCDAVWESSRAAVLPISSGRSPTGRI